MSIVDDRRAQVLELRAQGLIWREIAERLGISRSYAHQLSTNDPLGRQRKAKYSQPCVDCGAFTNPGGLIDGEPRCIPCNNRVLAEARRVWTRELVIDRIREWAELHGEPPATPDWRPYQARNVVHDDARARRFEEADGYWPAAETVIRLFGGWGLGLEAAGFTPRPPHGGGGNIDRRRDRQRRREAA